MKLVIEIIALLVMPFLVLEAGASPRDAQWKQVQDAINKGLPKTAITNLEPIIQGALKDKAYAEAAKAIGRKLNLEANIQGNKPEEKITRLQSEISKAPKEMVPVLDTLLAHWYWQYFQQNRWRFMQRTATEAAPGKDFTTWGLSRLFLAISGQFQKALAAETILKAIGLYQALLRFHKADPAPQLAFADVDLERLHWGWNTAFGEDKNTRYKAALQGFIRTYGDFDLSTLAIEHEARVLQQENDLVASHTLAERGARLFPGSPGNKLCRNLVAEIEAKSATISTERVWNCFEPGGAGTSATANPNACPTLTVHYRNVDVVYFRAVPCDWEIFLEKGHNRPENLSLEERREIISKPAAFAWSEQLPPTADFKEKTALLPAPRKLKAGFYFLVASHDPGFAEKENIVSMT